MITLRLLATLVAWMVNAMQQQGRQAGQVWVNGNLKSAASETRLVETWLAAQLWTETGGGDLRKVTGRRGIPVEV